MKVVERRDEGCRGGEMKVGERRDIKVVKRRDEGCKEER